MQIKLDMHRRLCYHHNVCINIGMLETVNDTRDTDGSLGPEYIKKNQAAQFRREFCDTDWWVQAAARQIAAVPGPARVTAGCWGRDEKIHRLRHFTGNFHAVNRLLTTA